MIRGWHAHHSSGPKYFVYPDEWKPERWTTQPDLVLDKRAYHPFLKGKHHIRAQPFRIGTFYDHWS